MLVAQPVAAPWVPAARRLDPRPAAQAGRPVVAQLAALPEAAALQAVQLAAFPAARPVVAWARRELAAMAAGVAS